MPLVGRNKTVLLNLCVLLSQLLKVVPYTSGKI